MRTAAAILRKDLLLELRTLETLPGMALLSVVTFVIFHFGLNQDTLSGQLAAGVLTVTLLFAAMLAVNRLFVAEREQGGFDAFLLAPVDRTAMFTAKATALFLFMVALEVIAVPAFAVLLAPPSFGRSLPAIVLMLVLADGAFAVIGTFVSAIAVHTRARDLIGPVIGAAIVNLSKSFFTVAFPDYWLFFLGALFVGVTLWLPEGVVGLWQRVMNKRAA